MAAAIALLVCASVSVAASEDTFIFVKPDYFRRTDDDQCKICYGDNDCLTMNQARCELYTATSEVLFEDDGPEDSSSPELRIQVDSLMMGLAEQSYLHNLRKSQECIPYVSQYTDCTKENICFGCQSCTCSEDSKWNCSFVQRCRPEAQLVPNHRDLVFAMETLRGDGNPSFRLKRSLSATPVPIPHNLTFEEIAEWLYDVKPFSYNNTNRSDSDATFGTTDGKIEILTTVAADARKRNNNDDNNVDVDQLTFDEALSNMSTKNKNHTQQKTLNLDKILEHDYMEFDDANVTLYDFNEVTMTNQFLHILNAIGEEDDPKTTSTTESVTKVVIDLLELARKRMDIRNDINDTDPEITLQSDTRFDDVNNNYEFNTINIVKRDVVQVTESNLNLTVTEKVSITNTSNELKDSVYIPINSIIQDKQKELEDLLRVRENLIKILNLTGSNQYLLNNNKSETVENGSNSYISFYNLQIGPQTEYDSKRSGFDLLEKYLKKLRHDVYVVIRDIVSIQTITGPKDLPKDIKLLTRAIKHFMRNHTKSYRKNKMSSVDNVFDLRRYQDNSYTTKDFVKLNLINILLLIDRDLPQNNALAPLSTKSRKIVKRVLKNHKLNNVSVFGLRVNDPNYNLTNDLKSIGVNWQYMAVKISDSSPWDRLHDLKLLQLVLEADISKMKDALALIDFAHSRRMIAIQNNVGKDELLRINNNLRSIHNKIKDITKLSSLNKSGNKIVKIFTITKKNKKETFLKHVRDLLKTSRKDIVNLLRKKVPKSVIVKELAKKKLNEMTKKKLIEFENAMQKWQNNLDIKRKKRSYIFEKLTNILPKYLRGKVSSKVNSTKHKTRSKPKHSKRKTSKKNNKKNTTITASTVISPTISQSINQRSLRTKVKKITNQNSKRNIAAKSKTVKNRMPNHNKTNH